MKNSNPILVIGANGKTGLRVNALLKAQGYQTRAVSRSTPISFDWGKPATWAAALKGVKQAYITYQPDLAVPSAEPTMQAFVQAAKDQGLEHLVLLSGRGEDGAIKGENIIKQSGLRWNIVRASWFFQNFSESFLVDGVQNGEVHLAVGPVPEPFVDCDDIAEVAVAALTRPELANQLFEVTGPELMSFADCVAEIASQSGRDIRYTQVPVEPYMAHLKEIGLSDDELWLLRELFTKVLDGRNSNLTSGVEQALGRKPKPFANYVKNALANKAWEFVENKTA